MSVYDYIPPLFEGFEDGDDDGFEPVDLIYEVILQETEKAWCVRLKWFPLLRVWFPKRLCRINYKEHRITVPLWLAEDKIGIIPDGYI